MKRRAFLGAATLGAAAATVPAWVDRAFAQQLDPDRYAAEVANAYRRAALAGRPVLLVVIPPDAQKHERGQLWGELLNHGADGQLWPLALVEVVAADLASARRILPSLPGEEAIAVVVETDGSQRSTAVTVDVPSIGWAAHPPELVGADPEEWLNRRIDQRIERLAGALEAAIAGDVRMLEGRADAARARLGAADRTRIDHLLRSSARVPADLVRAAPAIVALAAHRAGAAVLYARLAAVVREDLVECAMPGARWARNGGCGTTIEELPDDQQVMMGCGMGHVPERSQRFVHFFAVRSR